MMSAMDRCARLLAPIDEPDDPAELARWERAAIARQRLLEEVGVVLELPCERVDTAFVALFASESRLLSELRVLRHGSFWHFDRWSDENFSPAVPPDEMAFLFRCGRILSPSVKRDLRPLLTPESCQIVALSNQETPPPDLAVFPVEN
jgi:hypothetical protein